MTEERTFPERMAEFFDARSEGYDVHMERSVAGFDRFYRSIADPIPETADSLRILNIGCGTGLELVAVLSRAPHLIITGIDVSEGMLLQLREKSANGREQLDLVRGSYLDVPLGEGVYDYVLAVMTLHHLLPGKKVGLYRRIGAALRADGAYIEGDCVVSLQKERRYLSEYGERMRGLRMSRDGGHRLDVPLSLDTQRNLLIEAGFSRVEVIWRGDGSAVCVARSWGLDSTGGSIRSVGGGPRR